MTIPRHELKSLGQLINSAGETEDRGEALAMLVNAAERLDEVRHELDHQIQSLRHLLSNDQQPDLFGLNDDAPCLCGDGGHQNMECLDDEEMTR